MRVFIYIYFMKQQLTLLEVCKLPDVQIHSKMAFLKSIVNTQSPQILTMRQNIARLSYTVKIMGIKDQDMGIISKRLPLKYKDTTNIKNSKNPETNSIKYLPHKSFYSAPLGTIKKEKTKLDSEFSKHNDLQINARGNYVKNQSFRISTAFKARSRSHSNFKTVNSKASVGQILKQKNKGQKSLVKPTIEHQIYEDKYSFSKSLSQLNKSKTKQKTLNPLLHEQHPLFRTLRKINQKVKQIKEDENQTQIFVKLNKIESV